MSSETARGCLCAILVAAAACGSSARRAGDTTVSSPERRADVIAVEVTGEPGDYVFSVAVASPDNGCEHYADWWEVVSRKGELLYRRILAHSHVDEQPFARSGGPVRVRPDDVVLVRAHMSSGGYGGVMRGSVATGFVPEPTVPSNFAADLSKAEPQPDGCAF